MKKAIIYARYSSGSQTEQSIEGQLRVCHKYAEENNLIVVKEYVDRAKTGQNDRRPSFQKMLYDSNNKDFDFIIVYSIDRFARDDGDHGADKRLLRDNGVLLLSATQTIGINADGTENLGGILTEGIYVALAKYYSRELAQKVRRGQKESIEKKNYLGGNIAYGYYVKDKKLCINQDEAVIVKEIFEQYSKGRTAKEIAKALKEKAISNSIGKQFKPNGIMKMLKNPKYIGTFQYGGNLYEDYLPAIIEKNMFEMVQERIASNARTPSRAKAKEMFILTGKLYCGYCKMPMAGESGTSRTGDIYHYYKCSKRKRQKDCSKKNIKKKELEDIVINNTLKHILSTDSINQITEQILLFQDEKRKVTEIALLNQQLTEVNSFIKNILTAIKKGIITSSTQNELENLETEKSNIERKIVQTDFEESFLTRDKIAFWFEQFANFNTQDEGAREYLIHYFINRLILYDDKLIIIYNHDGDNRTELEIDEIEEAFGSSLEALSLPTKTRGCLFLLEKYNLLGGI
ncbi:MAG: recombinase family protein [Clostridia bacterium]